jgi:hypothetical protein
MIAKKVGLPKEHWDFFYEYRNDFKFEIKQDIKIHCTGNKGHCKFTTEVFENCLVDHMVESHSFGKFPCTKNVDCKFMAYSKECLKQHISKFHGSGRVVPTKDQRYSCKFKSCSYMAARVSALEIHHRVHENRLLLCQFCNYTSNWPYDMRDHMRYHFQIKTQECPVCNLSFINLKALNTHIKFHSSDFSCIHCHLSFKTVHRLNVHIISCERRLSKLY